MQKITQYTTPLGEILLSADSDALTGLWFLDQKYFPKTLPQTALREDLPVFTQAKNWLDLYFSGQIPDFSLPLHPRGTPFQQEVWKLLQTIPLGKTTTYGEIAKKIAQKRGLASMSAQAVGSAVGHNPISILIPCHRVVGKTGNLTGYAGGIHRKAALLALEAKKTLP